MRKALALLALLVAGLWAAPALAASSPTVDLAAWVKTNTDLAVTQVAIAGPENVYSLEPIGPRLPTGEVLALVRTEAVSDDWRAAHQFQSWDAHLLFDCQGGRVRVLRSASYQDRDRQGPAKADDRGDAWFQPAAETPAAALLAAACDPGFKWPLRESAAAAPSTPAPENAPPVIQTASPPAPQETAPVQPHLLKAASPEMAQFASAVSDRQAVQPIQKASFTTHAALREASSAPAQSAAPPRREGFFATAVAATRTCKRLASAGGGWLVRRVEAVFQARGAAPPQVAGMSKQIRSS